jgi:serine/threonine protein phosphatase PrpC
MLVSISEMTSPGDALSSLSADASLGANLSGPAMARTGRRRSAAVMAHSKEEVDREPVLAKANCQEHFTMKFNSDIQIAACGIQGWRKTNEDAHCVLLTDSLASVDASRAPTRFPSNSVNHGGSRPASPAPTSPSPCSPPPSSTAPSPDARPAEPSDGQDMLFEGTSIVAMLGIFDGHNGRAAADFAAANMPRFIAAKAKCIDDDASKEAMITAIQSAFNECDDAMREHGVGESGCTAACVIVTRKDVVLCSAGDCRLAAFCREGTVVVSIENDHSPSKNSDEMERLASIGIPVVDGRVLGRLAVSRALGDFPFKPIDVPRSHHGVWSTPTVAIGPREAIDFVIAGCDGVWELNSIAHAAQLVRGERGNIDDAITRVARTSCSTVRPLNPMTQQLQPGNDNITFGAVFFRPETLPPM